MKGCVEKQRLTRVYILDHTDPGLPSELSGIRGDVLLQIRLLKAGRDHAVIIHCHQECRGTLQM